MATVAWSGLWDNVYAGGHSLIVNKNNLRNLVANHMRKYGMAKDRAILNVLIGATAGSTATLSRSRVTATAGGENLGGSRAIESASIINRATTAADVTAMKDYLSNIDDRKPTYAVDLAGNGAR
jgi:hypothetical protein